MKIDQDLRAAIRSAEKAQPDNYEVRTKANQEAIAKFFKDKPSFKLKWWRAQQNRKKSRELTDRAQALELEIGVYQCGSILRFHGDGETFRKNGGKSAPEGHRWKFDKVMTELAAAEPKQLTTILKKYGINWK